MRFRAGLALHKLIEVPKPTTALQKLVLNSFVSVPTNLR